MKLSSMGKGGVLYMGAPITGNRTLVEADLNKFFSVTGASVITLPKPSDIKSRWGETIVINKLTSSNVTLALAAGASLDGQAAPFSLIEGVPVRLLVTSNSSWALECVHPVSHPASMIVQDANNRFVTDSDKTKWTARGRGFRAYAAADQTVPAGVLTKVAFATVSWDDYVAFSANSFTVPSDGRYLFTASVLLTGVTTDRMHSIYLKKDGFTFDYESVVSYGESNILLTVTGIMIMFVDEVVDVHVLAAGTVNRTIMAGAGTRFEAALLG